MKRILLPVDGSVTCFGAFDYAKNLAFRILMQRLLY